MRKSKLTDRQIANLYLVGLLSAAKIAQLAGVSDVAVWKRLQRMGLPTSKWAENGSNEACATRLTVKCAYCARLIQRHRSKVLGCEVHYCNNECHTAARIHKYADPADAANLQRRAKVAAYFKLQPNHVVIERNHKFLVFSDQEQAIAWSRRRKVEPLWEGTADDPA